MDDRATRRETTQQTSDRDAASPPRPPGASRRSFLRGTAALVVAGQALWRTGDVRAAGHAANRAVGRPKAWPDTGRRVLGRTGFEGSRLVFGCGAALSRGPKDDLLEAALEAGINVFDNGTRRYYHDAEVNLAPFLARHKAKRDEIFLISKAMTYLEVGPNEPITAAQGREGAATWTGLLDQSLRELAVDHVDAYYVMGSNNPHIVKSEEMRRAFERARDAGKVKHWGLSSHENARAVLEAAVETGWYDLAQIAITPAGWYDWGEKDILRGPGDMKAIRPFLDEVRGSGMALIGMKAGRYLAGRKFLGWGKPNAFDEHYGPDVLASGLSPFQRSYAYVLAHGLDAVNADMQSFAHLEENVAAAAKAPTLFA